MRITIIILGIIGLLFLGLNWAKVSPNAETIPKDGSVLHSNETFDKSSDKEGILLCPKCKEGDKIVQVIGMPSQNICKIHQTVAINL